MTRSDPPDTGPRVSRRPTLSLKGRALKCLAAREHSRVELTRKLAPHAESPEQVAQVLDELEQKGWLSAQRFADSMLHRKAARYGAARLKAELAQHQLPSEVAHAATQSLRDTEFERAHALWLRRFGEPAQSPEDKARQMRFLLNRGFASDVVRRVIRGDGLLTGE
ncbi:MAG: recombination regulator RecX [Aquabacterium sp.]|uniref:recombination regulator RecX n=1 Tax=Aquabacterium sp. TaxID=1872578 RepID=UPI002A361147|nr:recombination regulator RecX [Aquabacterium sp.]MDX9843311.1 recombination regulator RecX [Aquabacterium sp.]